MLIPFANYLKKYIFWKSQNRKMMFRINSIWLKSDFWSISCCFLLSLPRIWGIPAWDHPLNRELCFDKWHRLYHSPVALFRKLLPGTMTSDISKVWKSPSPKQCRQWQQAILRSFIFKKNQVIRCMFNVSTFTFAIDEHVILDVINNSEQKLNKIR